MLETVDVGTQCIACYETSAGAEVVSQLRELAAPLAGARVLHLNATPYGGGVAGILRSEVPLLRDLGLAADWRVIAGDAAFFNTTKAIHNGLQGAARDITPDEQTAYLDTAGRNAKQLDVAGYDLIVVHDPQPLAMLQFAGKGAARCVWRCDTDTSEPHASVWSFLRPYLQAYDAAVFTLGGFAPPDLPVRRVEIIPPAIDPESPKSLELDLGLARRVLQWIGVELDPPLLTQVSRFDPWKDPLGVIAAYRQVKREVPNVQLALVGSMALDDPEGWEIYRQVRDSAKDDAAILLFTNLTGVGNVEVNAFQRLSDVVIQKSLREGFGLVVSEALWKRTPVVAGRAGGIPLQLQDGAGGFLVDRVDECADHVLWLLRHPAEARALGERGRSLVRDRFLLTRLIGDELRLYGSLLETASLSQPAAAQVGLAHEERDPVCGMRMDAHKAPTLTSRVATTRSARTHAASSSPVRRRSSCGHIRLWLDEMSELRQDPCTRDWVVIAPRRSERPHTVSAPRQKLGIGTSHGCPFCPGHEPETPPEIRRLEPDGSVRRKAAMLASFQWAASVDMR